MAFILTHTAISTIFEVESSGSVFFVTATVGIDPELDAAYSITVSLYFGLPCYGAELNFWITERRGDIVTDVFWDGTRTRFIRGADRNAILQWLLIATEVLISAAGVDCVTMTTMEANLPITALNKYLRIKNVFTKCGYSVSEREPFHGIKCVDSELTCPVLVAHQMSASSASVLPVGLWATRLRCPHFHRRAAERI